MNLALYIHIPYCAKKCPYCDFNSYAVSKAELDKQEENYTESLIKEYNHWLPTLEEPNVSISSIFFGGGTPSLFSENSISRILEAIQTSATFSSDIEVTLEANPGSIDEPLAVEKLKKFKSAGVNRISMGCQSFSDKKLKFLGRLHTSEQSEKAISNILDAGFKNLNLDLMFGVKGETKEEWVSDLEKALSFDTPHISAYNLTIEPGTEFGVQSKKGFILTAGEEIESTLYLQTQDILEKAGLSQYELSNYAKTNKTCRHNLTYWSRKPYLGLGAGAHSFANFKQSQSAFESESSDYGTRWWNTPGPAQYLDSINNKGQAVSKSEQIDLKQFQIEKVFLGTRTRFGFSLDELKLINNENLKSTAQELEQLGLVSLQDSVCTTTRKGMLFANSIAEKLVQAL